MAGGIGRPASDVIRGFEAALRRPRGILLPPAGDRHFTHRGATIGPDQDVPHPQTVQLRDVRRKYAIGPDDDFKIRVVVAAAIITHDPDPGARGGPAVKTDELARHRHNFGVCPQGGAEEEPERQCAWERKSAQKCGHDLYL